MSPTEPIDLLRVRTLLDELLLQLPQADPSLPREAAADGLSRALAHVYAALAAGGNLDQFRNETSAALGQAQRALASLEPHSAESESAGQLVALISQAAQAISEVRYRILPETLVLPRLSEAKPWLRASVGEPTLLDFNRPMLRPAVPLLPEEAEDPLQPPPEIDLSEDAPAEPIPELEAELARVGKAEPEEEEREPAPPAPEPLEQAPLPAGPASDQKLEEAYFGTVTSAEQILFQQARICLEEMGTLSLMRRPEPDQGWFGRAEPERRLLARVDAIVACGAPVFPRLVSVLEDRPVPDPELTWALLFFFGSLAGDDAHDELMRLARLAPLDDSPEMVAAAADALALVPHPRTTVALRAWLDDPMAERRLVAFKALSRRGALETVEAQAFAAEADACFAEAAADALATSSGAVDARLLFSLMQRPEEPVAAAAIRSAVIRRLDHGRQMALTLVTQGRADFAGAAGVLSVTGGSEAFPPLLRAAEAGSAAACEALGWYGSLEAVDFLLGQLEGKNKLPALLALQRLTAASLTAEDPAPEYEPDELPFAQPREQLPDAEDLLPDPAPWRSWWERHKANAKMSARHRFGFLWSPRDSLRELEAPHAVRQNRRLAFLELCVRSEVSAPLDLEGFVAKQKAQLAAWSALLGQLRRSGTGTWPAPGSR